MGVELIWLPALALHPPMVADSSAPISRLTVHSQGVDTTLGLDVPVVGKDAAADAPTGISWRLGIFGSVRLGLHPGGALTFNLETVDGAFGVPLDLRVGRTDARFAWAHESAHFADGIRASSGALPHDRSPYSREWVLGIVGVRFAGLRTYIGLHQAVHMAGGTIPGPEVQLGWTWDGESAVALYQATDLRLVSEFDWKYAGAGQAGVRFRGEGGQVARLGLVARTGLAEAGMRAAETEHYAGLTVVFDGITPLR